MLPSFSFPYATATSMSLAYSGFFAACRIREGLVVASWGLYLPMASLCQFCIREIDFSARRREFEMNWGCWDEWGSLQAKSPVKHLVSFNFKERCADWTYQSHWRQSVPQKIVSNLISSSMWCCKAILPSNKICLNRWQIAGISDLKRKNLRCQRPSIVLMSLTCLRWLIWVSLNLFGTSRRSGCGWGKVFKWLRATDLRWCF